MCWVVVLFFFFQAEDGIRDAQESRGLGDVYKRQAICLRVVFLTMVFPPVFNAVTTKLARILTRSLSLIHISEPTRLLSISYAVFCLKKKKKKPNKHNSLPKTKKKTKNIQKKTQNK